MHHKPSNQKVADRRPWSCRRATRTARHRPPWLARGQMAPASSVKLNVQIRTRGRPQFAEGSLRSCPVSQLRCSLTHILVMWFRLWASVSEAYSGLRLTKILLNPECQAVALASPTHGLSSIYYPGLLCHCSTLSHFIVKFIFSTGVN